jgi:hypothetical protein
MVSVIFAADISSNAIPWESWTFDRFVLRSTSTDELGMFVVVPQCVDRSLSIVAA